MPAHDNIRCKNHNERQEYEIKGRRGVIYMGEDGGEVRVVNVSSAQGK